MHPEILPLNPKPKPLTLNCIIPKPCFRPNAQEGWHLNEGIACEDVEVANLHRLFMSVRVEGPASTREFPKIRGTVFWGPYNKDPTI